MDRERMESFAKYMLGRKSTLACLVMLVFMLADFAARPAHPYMAGLDWLSCSAKACYLASWLVWAYFFTRQFLPGYDDSIGWFRKNEKPDPPSEFSKEDLVARLV